MATLDHIHQAIKILHPTSTGMTQDYIWAAIEDGQEPTMVFWNEERFGPLNMNNILAKCAEIEEGGLPGSDVTSISRKQFFQALAQTEVITEAEAIAALATGTIPAALQAAIDGLPEDMKFAATMAVIGEQSFELQHPITQAIKESIGWTDQQAQDLFNLAGTL